MLQSDSEFISHNKTIPIYGIFIDDTIENDDDFDYDTDTTETEVDDDSTSDYNPETDSESSEYNTYLNNKLSQKETSPYSGSAQTNSEIQRIEPIRVNTNVFSLFLRKCSGCFFSR